MTASAEKPPGRRVLKTLFRPGVSSNPQGQRTWRKRLGNAGRMLGALAMAGGVYAALIPAAQSQEAPATPVTLSQEAQEGKALYNNSCIYCHGPNAEGVTDRGPSLIGVGGAAVNFQVSTGRMPMAAQGAQARPKEPVFNSEQTNQLAAYIQALGGGPEMPDDVSGGDVANGAQLYELNCMSCHGGGLGGGALSSGKWAPHISDTSAENIYAAMLTGPQSMPVFRDTFTPQEMKDVVAYVRYQATDMNQGGYGLGRLGPVTEGLAIFLVGTTAMCFAALWIAGKE